MSVIVIQNSNKSVFVDGFSEANLTITIPADVQSLRWDNGTGTIFFNNGSFQTIAELPAWATAAVAVFNANPPTPDPIPQPTLQEQASQELYLTDWTSIPDITDPAKCTPTLTNQQDFLTYRNQLRAIALGLQGALPQLPVKPTAQWSA